MEEYAKTLKQQIEILKRIQKENTNSEFIHRLAITICDLSEKYSRIPDVEKEPE